MCVDAFSVGGFSLSLGERVTHDKLQESLDAFILGEFSLGSL